MNPFTACRGLPYDWHLAPRAPDFETPAEAPKYDMYDSYAGPSSPVARADRESEFVDPSAASRRAPWREGSGSRLSGGGTGSSTEGLGAGHRGPGWRWGGSAGFARSASGSSGGGGTDLGHGVARVVSPGERRGSAARDVSGNNGGTGRLGKLRFGKKRGARGGRGGGAESAGGGSRSGGGSRTGGARSEGLMTGVPSTQERRSGDIELGM